MDEPQADMLEIPSSPTEHQAGLPDSPVLGRTSPKLTDVDEEELQRSRANALLIAALSREPPQVDLLRAAISQAQTAGVEGKAIARAESLLSREEEKRRILE